MQLQRIWLRLLRVAHSQVPRVLFRAVRQVLRVLTTRELTSSKI
jgi:hypothetical protein